MRERPPAARLATRASDPAAPSEELAHLVDAGDAVGVEAARPRGVDVDLIVVEK